MKKHLSFILIFILFSGSLVYSQDWKQSIKLESTSNIEVTEIKRDNNSNIYVCGVFSGTIENIAEPVTSQEMLDIFVAKYNSSLELLWLKRIGGPGQDFEPQMDVDNDKLLLTGTFQDSVYFDGVLPLEVIGSIDVFISRFDLNGNIQNSSLLFWESDYHYSRDLMILNSNEYLITGYFYDDSVNIHNDTIIEARAGAWNAFYSKHRISDNHTLWAKYNDLNTNVKYSNIAQYNNNIFLNGYFTDSLYFDIETIESKNGSRDLFLYSLDQEGNGQWLRRTYGSSSDATATMDYDTYGNLYFGGYYRSDDFVTDSTENFVSDTSHVRQYYDLFLMKYNKSGNLQWKKDYGSDGKEWTKSIVERNGIVYMGGYYSDTLKFGSDTLTTDSVNDYGVLLGTFDANGNMLEGVGVNGPGGDDVANTMTVDDQNNVYLAGYFDSESIQFGEDFYTNPNPGTKVAFIAKYVPPFNVTFTEKQNITCHGGSDGQLTVTPYFGVPPYTYEWSHDAGLGDSTATGLTAGEYTVTVTDSRDSTDVLTTTLTQPDSIVFNGVIKVDGVETDSLNCYGAQNGEILISPQGGNSGYNYAWNTTSGSGVVLTDQNQSGLSSGDYNVEITDSEGCKADTSFLIKEPDPVVFTGTTHENIGNFQDGSIDLQVSGGTGDVANFSYYWDGPDPLLPADTTQDLTNLTYDGNYTVDVTDENACVFDTTINVADTSDFYIYFKSADIKDVSCNGGADGEAIITVLESTGTLSYTWEDSEGTGLGVNDSTITGLSAGKYYVTVDDTEQGTLMDSVVIEQPDPMVLTLTSATTDTLTCYGDSDGIIDLEVSGGNAPYTYTWADGPETQDRTDLAAGAYSVEISDGNGCLADTTWTIHSRSQIIPDVSVVEEITCYGYQNGKMRADPTGGNGAPYDYQWNDPAHQTTQMADGLEAGYYRVTVTDPEGCEAEEGLALEQPDPLEVSADLTDVRCHGGSDGLIDITTSGGTSPYNYFWSTEDGSGIEGSETAPDQSGLTEGTYTVEITDGHNCTLEKSFTIEQPDNPISIDTESSTDITTCYGDSTGTITVSASGGTGVLTYTLNPGAIETNNTGEFTELGGGEYTVDVTDENNCIVTSSNLVINQPDEIVITNVTSSDVTESGGGSITVEAAGGTGTLSYILGDSISVNQTGEFTGLEPGDYKVYVTDINECGPDSTDVITIENIIDGINDADYASLEIYPNPSTGKLNVSFELKRQNDVLIEVINTMGQIVFSETYKTSGKNFKEIIDLNGLPAGLYFFKLTSEEKMIGKESIILK